MPYSCSKETLLARLFLNATKALSLLFLFFFHLFSSLFWYGQDSDYDDSQSDEDEEEEALVEEEGFGYYRNVQGDDDFVSHDGMRSCCSDYYPDHDDEWLSYGDQMVTVEDISGREDSYLDQVEEEGNGEMQLSRDDKFLIFAPPAGAEARKQSICNEAVGSHWRSSITYHRYDQEMMFLDTTTTTTTDSLKSLQVEPRSISQSFVHQLARTTSKSKQRSSDRNVNPYHELESGYVAQICLAWEILSWDYTNFRCKLSLLRQQGVASDPGFPAQVAQQFQQFQVLLRRYVESEPYEYGKRPEIYARIKSNVAPKLLLVPQIQDYEEDDKEDVSSRISSASFLSILENSIRTFMDFLKADKESCCQAMITALFRTRKAGSIDPALVMVMRKTNRMKKLKVKKLQRAGKCIRRRKKVTKEEEMEMLMGLIDLKVVARVLRMWDLTRQQVRWCEEKMTKLTLSKVGHLHRDSSPLFFPPH